MRPRWTVKTNTMQNTIYEMDSRIKKNGVPLRWVVVPAVRHDQIQWRIDASDDGLVPDDMPPFFDNLYYAMRYCEREGLFVGQDDDTFVAKRLSSDGIFFEEDIIGTGASEDEAIQNFIDQCGQWI